MSIFPGNDRYLERILGEVRLFSKLNHPNIVRYFQAWIEDIDPNDLTINFSEDFYFGESDEESSKCDIGYP
jgi:serine/threonine protein kinase